MLERAPAPVPTRVLEPLGRARRFTLDDGSELFRLAPDDVALAGRLLDLGFGFVAGGVDDDGPWLRRRRDGTTLDRLARGERPAADRALAILGAAARTLARFERAGFFPGPLRPQDVAWVQARPDADVDAPAPRAVDAWLVLDAGLEILLHVARDGKARTGASPRWTPPAQVEGADWDSAANRYVLGLVAYRLLAGEHPFSGAGMRHALAEQRVGASPLEDDVRRGLPPGIESLVLEMLSPDAGARPRSAEEIAQRLEAAGAGTALPDAHVTSARATEARGVGRPAAAKPAKRARRTDPGVGERPAKAWAAIAPFVFVALGAAALAWSYSGAEPGSATRDPVQIGRERALVRTRPEDCVGCHAQEVSEWRRSVMAHAAKSPLFGALDSAVQEQIGRDGDCPNGAGALRRVGASACRNPRTGVTVTGAGGEHWCTNCHAGTETARREVPAWEANGDPRTRRPLRDLLSDESLDGVSCALCHQTEGPVGPHGGNQRYEGNATWTSPISGAVFLTRPEDGAGRTGIGNSGYRLDAASLLGGVAEKGLVHKRTSPAARSYLRTSEFCGSCHDVRLFGTDVLGVRERGEHFKRLRNGYSEWRSWATLEEQKGRKPATCQGCHMGLYPGICVQNTSKPTAAGGACPPGTVFEARAPVEYLRGGVTPAGPSRAKVSHYFTSVDIPLTESYDAAFIDAPGLDASGLPIGLRARQRLLLEHTFHFALGEARRRGSEIEVPIEIENTGAGHRVPAGFSQEREIWVELTVRDASGRVVYEVGKVDGNDRDLADKILSRVNTQDTNVDRQGRPLGVFGADVADGPDVPRWSPDPRLGGTRFRGRGLVNLQNGFLRCVRCIGVVDGGGRCQPVSAAQAATRAGRFDDAPYDLDTGECRSNLSGGNELFETYFPVGALDADRGILKAPDAIIDTRSAPPAVPLSYTYVLDVRGASPPFTVDATLHFRAFPPFLIRAFAAYEARMAARGLRPSGPQVTESMLKRIEVLDLARAHGKID